MHLMQSKEMAYITCTCAFRTVRRALLFRIIRRVHFEIRCHVTVEDDVVPVIGDSLAGLHPARDAAFQVEHLGETGPDQFPGGFGAAFAAPAIDGDRFGEVQAVGRLLRESLIVDIEIDGARDVFFREFFGCPDVYELEFRSGDGRLEISRGKGLVFLTAAGQRGRGGQQGSEDSFHVYAYSIFFGIQGPPGPAR